MKKRNFHWFSHHVNYFQNVLGDIVHRSDIESATDYEPYKQFWPIAEEVNKAYQKAKYDTYSNTLLKLWLKAYNKTKKPLPRAVLIGLIADPLPELVSRLEKAAGRNEKEKVLLYWIKHRSGA